MNTHHPIHHINKREQKARLRAIIDIVIVVIAILLGVLFIIGHVSERNQEREDRARANALRSMYDTLAQPKEEFTPTLARVPKGATPEDRVAVVSPKESTTTHKITPEESARLVETQSTSTMPTAPTTTSLAYPRYEDVTSTRLHYARLGFVMEIPSGWGVVSERADSVLLSLLSLPNQSTIDRVVREPGAVWVHIERPCTDTVATSSRFAFGTTTDIGVREATTCIPPLLVTLGYRSDAPDPVGRERFLLSIGRTLLPVVP
jgi:hypothetical protein